MEEALKKMREKMDEDEKILWTARPETFETLDKTNKMAYRNKVIRSVLITAAVIVLYVLLAMHYQARIMPGLIAVMLACGIYASVSDLLLARSLRRNVVYAATDKRLYLIQDSVKAVGYEAIPAADFRTDADGHTSLLCGKTALEKKPQAWRSAVTAGDTVDFETGICEDLVFYAIPEADKVKTLLRDYLSLK